jgi:hypothetical protein
MTALDTRTRRWWIQFVALTAGLTLAGCGAAGLSGGVNGTSSSATPSPSASSPTPSPTASSTPSGDVTIAMLTTIAEQAARGDGDPGVRVADAVLTTRQAAVTLTSGDLINSNEAVYLVQLLGHFTLTDVPIPPGGTPPTGIALSFDIDVSDGNVVDTGLAHKAADLSSLGPLIVLPL